MVPHYRSPEIECASRDRLRALQTEKLLKTLEQVSATRFYREKFDGAGVCPKSIGDIEELPALPFTTKADLWENYPFGALATSPKEVVRVHGSSGTRGRLTLVSYTEQDIRNWAELCARSLAAAGVVPGMKVLNAYGYGLFTGGLGFHNGAERLPATVIPVSGNHALRQLLRDLKPEVICCTPSFAVGLADALQDGATPNSLKLGVLGAETWSDAMRVQIERRLGIVAKDTYGLSEVGGPGVAQECPCNAGLHIWEDHFLPEIIDPKTGAVLPFGEEGELVLTTLEKEAMPLVRYRTGDITAISQDSCECGRTHARMQRVRGRVDDMIVLRGVNVYPSEIERILLSVEEVLPFYEVILDRPTNLDRLSVRVECQSVVFENSLNVELERRIHKELWEGCAVRVDVTLCRPSELKRSEGKAVRVIDKRKA